MKSLQVVSEITAICQEMRDFDYETEMLSDLKSNLRLSLAVERQTMCLFWCLVSAC